MVAKLKAYAEAHIPLAARMPAIRAMAKIAYYAKIKKERLPEVDRWLAGRHS